MCSAVIQAKNRDIKGKPSTIPSITARPEREYKVHNVGNIWSTTSNFGNYGEPNATMPSGEWPSGTEIYYIWEGRFWIGALVGGEKLCSHADYGNYELDPAEGSTFGFGPTVSDPKSVQDSYVIFDDLQEVGGHTPIGLRIVQRGLSWSIPGYDNFIAYEYYLINVSGQTLNGVYAAWIFDNDVAGGPGGDADQPHIDDLVDYDGYTGTEDSNPYAYDVVENYDINENGELDGYDEWGWPYGRSDNRPSDGVDLNVNYDLDKIHPDGIWDEFQVYVDDSGPVIYRHDYPDSAYVTASGDTLHGWLLPRNTSYMYDSDYPSSSENDVGERSLTGTNAGFIGGRLIWTDMPPYPGEEFFRPNVHQWWNWESDPGSDEEKYQFMEATHPASLNLHFLPHPFNYLAGAPTFDYRYLSSTGPFDLPDGDTLRFVCAYGIGMGLEGLREVMDNAMYAYYSGSEWSNPANPSDFDADAHWILPIPPLIPVLNYSPGDRQVQFMWDSAAEDAIDVFFGTTDFEGYKVYRSIYNASAWDLIFACDNVDGPVYLLNTAGDTLNPGNPVDLPGINDEWGSTVIGDSLLYYNDHTFIDKGGENPWGAVIETPINGLPYYYAVCAYDPPKPDLGMPSIESAKSNYKKSPQGAPAPVIPYSAPGPNDLSKVKVVPNPYKGTSLFEARYEDKVFFTHLPPKSKISIFTLTGDLVRELYHNDNNIGDVEWDLVSRSNQAVVSGLYLYVVESEDEKKIGKMVIIR